MTTAPSDIVELVKRLRKVATCVYLATEASVADDISAHVKEAADRLEAQQAEIERLRKPSPVVTEEELARVIYEAVCASTDPGVSAWYSTIDRSEFLIAGRAVLSHLSGAHMSSTAGGVDVTAP